MTHTAENDAPVRDRLLIVLDGAVEGARLTYAEALAVLDAFDARPIPPGQDRP
jgi:hypothetical protein